MTNALAPISATATTKAVTRLTGVLASNIGKVKHKIRWIQP
ncbi:hypothetical protein O9992_25050 [Vibrio lentus]|nr:hypothetical protein [Vibrio lentus]